MLDIGPLYIKCGFSGESHPRHVVSTSSRLQQSVGREGESYRMDDEPAELYDLDFMMKSDLAQLEEKLKRLLHDIYYRLLLTDPKSRKVVLTESPLAPIALKSTLADLLFHHFQVPSICFVPTHLMALLTTGTTTGLVIDCGNLETSILPIYAARPLIPHITTTPLAGRAIGQRLKTLLLEHARYIPPSHLHSSLAPHTNVPESALTFEVIEDIKATVLFCSPLLVSIEQQNDTITAYKNLSSATDTYYPLPLKDGTNATLLIPGWIRERAADVLFEGSDEDEPSITHSVLDAMLKVQPDLRKPLMQSLLVIGGTSMLPGFHSRLKQELLRVMRDPTTYERKRYGSLLGLHKWVLFVDRSENNPGAGRIFMNNIRGWIGGSLLGSLKLSVEELVREKYKGTITDWSLNRWGSSTPSNTAD